MKRTKSHTTLIWIVTAIASVVILFPMYWIFLSAITPKDMLFTRPINYIPIAPSLENYVALFREVNVMPMAVNTLVMSFFTILVTVVFAVLAAYAFSRYNFPGKAPAYLFLVYSAMLPIVVTIVPMFQLFRGLKLTNTITGLVIINSSTFLPFTVMTFVSFIQGIPNTIEEAADVDGANVMVKIFQILMPLLRPAIATMAIIIFVWCMNEFMVALVFTNDRTMPLSVGITMIPRVDQYNIPWEKISALATIMLLPIVIFVSIFEKNIMEGLMAGSIKQ